MTDRPFSSGLAAAVWWAFRGILAVLGGFALVGFGGQVVLAPVLVPLEWAVARLSGRIGRALFVVLLALLVGEVAWILASLWLEPVSTPAIVVALGGTLGSGLLAWRTTGSPEPGPARGPGSRAGGGRKGGPPGSGSLSP